MTGPALLVEREGYNSTRRGQAFASHSESTELPSSIKTQETHPSPPATDVKMDDVSSPSHQPPSALSPPSHHTSTSAALLSSPSPQPPSTSPARLQQDHSHTPPPPSPPLETLPQEDSPPLSRDMIHESTTHPSQSPVDPTSPLQEAETPPQQSISPDTTTLSSPRPLHERISRHIPLSTDATVTQHTPSPADTKEDLAIHTPAASDLGVEKNYSYTDRDSFDWNVSWSSTAGTCDPSQSGTAKRTTSEGSDCDGIVAVAVCDIGAREGGVGYDESHDQIVTVSATPAPQGQRPVLESDTDITPMPDYRSMATPHLKVTRLGPQVGRSYCVSSLRASVQGLG